jgi:hypothetical protein
MSDVIAGIRPADRARGARVVANDHRAARCILDAHVAESPGVIFGLCLLSAGHGSMNTRPFTVRPDEILVIGDLLRCKVGS